MSDIDRWSKASSLLSRAQKAGESVDTYVTDMQNATRVVPITDQNLLRFAIVRGLKPTIRLHVLQSGAQTLEDVTKAARVAEVALSASEPSDEITKLTNQVTQLLARLDTKPAATATFTTSEGEGTRKVSFAPIDGNEGTNRYTSRPESPARSPVHSQFYGEYRRPSERSPSPRRQDFTSERLTGQPRNNAPSQWSNSTTASSNYRGRNMTFSNQSRDGNRAKPMNSPRIQPRWSSTPSASQGNCSNCAGVHASGGDHFVRHQDCVVSVVDVKVIYGAAVGRARGHLLLHHTRDTRLTLCQPTSNVQKQLVLGATM